MISGFVKASVFIAIAFVVAALLVSNSVPFYAGIAVSFANISASLVDKFGLEAAGTNQSTLAQPTAAVEPVTLTDNQPPAPNRNAASAPTEPVVENVESQPDVLFRQLQAWATAQAKVTRNLTKMFKMQRRRKVPLQSLLRLTQLYRSARTDRLLSVTRRRKC